MIEISFGKLVLLAVIALIVLGPEKLPGAARTAGALLRRMRSGWDSVRAEVERELQVEEIKRAAREVAAHADVAQAELDATLRQVRDPQTWVADTSNAPVSGNGEREVGNGQVSRIVVDAAVADPVPTSPTVVDTKAFAHEPATETSVEAPLTGDLFARVAVWPASVSKEPPHADV